MSDEMTNDAMPVLWAPIDNTDSYFYDKENHGTSDQPFIPAMSFDTEGDAVDFAELLGAKNAVPLFPLASMLPKLKKAPHSTDQNIKFEGVMSNYVVRYAGGAGEFFVFGHDRYMSYDDAVKYCQRHHDELVLNMLLANHPQKNEVLSWWKEGWG